MLTDQSPAAIHPAQDPRCPICGSTPDPIKTTERLNRGVMLGSYGDQSEHYWDTRWIPVTD